MHKSTPPSIKSTAFDCPHCGAFTTQYWIKLYAEYFDRNNPHPLIPAPNAKEILAADEELTAEQRKKLSDYVDRMGTGLVHLKSVQYKSPSYEIENLCLSKCYHCDKVAVWRHDSLIFPNQKLGVLPNQDLPEEIVRDFEEARSIVDLSPRGAVALLRLCLQKLCKHLGEAGSNINDDIASLVSKGLDPVIQQSLDVIRVVGNEAVHPGTLDLRDDRDTAVLLFEIINTICDQRISHPSKVQSLYGKLPPDKLAAIKRRDAQGGSKGTKNP